MRIQDICTPRAFTAFRDEPLAEAARTLCDRHVGALVVLDRSDHLRRPIGILTDRDIVRGELRRDADLYCLTVDDVMTSDPLVLPIGIDVTEAVEKLDTRSVRRAPLVNAAGSLQGIISLDDLLPIVAQDLSGLAALMGRQAHRERLRSA